MTRPLFVLIGLFALLAIEASGHGPLPGVGRALPAFSLRIAPSPQALPDRFAAPFTAPQLPLLKLSGRLYWLPGPQHLRGLLPTPDGLVLELSGFVPVALERTPEGLTLTLPNTLTLLPDAAYAWPHAWLRGGSLKRDAQLRRVRLTLALPPGAGVTLSRRQAGDQAIIALSFYDARWENGSTETHFQVHTFQLDTPAGPAVVHVVRVPQATQHFHLVPLLPPGGIGTLAPLLDLARRGNAALAINANFFDPASGLPIGLLIRDHQLQYEDYARRGALGVDVFGQLHLLRLGARAWVNLADRTLPLAGVNRPPKVDELVWLSPAYRQRVQLPQTALVVRVWNNAAVDALHTTAFIPDGSSGYLVAVGAAQTTLAGVQSGDALRIDNALTPTPPAPLKYALGAGPLLLQDGQLVLDATAEGFSPAFASARAARSALGWAPDGTLLLAVAPRDDRSAGLTFEELAGWLRDQGATEALALDGGGSASLAYRLGARWVQWGGSRPIAVGLGLVAR